MNLVSILRRTTIFAGFAEEHLARLASVAQEVWFEAGAMVACEGTPADRFYLVREGRVAIEVAIPGRGAVTVQTATAGALIGWSWIVPPHRWRFGVRTLTVVDALAFDGARLRESCDRDPAFGYAVLRPFAAQLTERLAAARLQLLDLYAPPDGDRRFGEGFRHGD